MIKQEIMAKRQARMLEMSPERKKQAQQILYHTQDDNETKWLKMSNAIPATFDFKMTPKSTRRSALPPLSPIKAGKNQSIWIPSKIHLKRDSNGTMSTNNSERKVSRNNTNFKTSTPKCAKKVSDSQGFTGIKLSLLDLDNISEECDSPLNLPNLKKIKSSFRQSTPIFSKQYSSNLHPNFQDLAQHYDGKRLSRAQHQAQIWNTQVGHKLHDEVDIQARQNFNSYIQKGNKLPYPQLRKLNSKWKRDYHKQIFNESENILEYIEQCGDDINEATEQVIEIQDQIDDTFDVVDETYKAINDAVIRKAVEVHMPKHHLTKFKEFNIRDMYLNKEKTTCLSCSKGMQCRRHQFQRKQLINEDDTAQKTFKF